MKKLVLLSMLVALTATFTSSAQKLVSSKTQIKFAQVLHRDSDAPFMLIVRCVIK